MYRIFETLFRHNSFSAVFDYIIKFFFGFNHTNIVFNLIFGKNKYSPSIFITVHFKYNTKHC